MLHKPMAEYDNVENGNIYSINQWLNMLIGENRNTLNKISNLSPYIFMLVQKLKLGRTKFTHL